MKLPTDPEVLRVPVREVIAERDAAIACCAQLEHLLDVARNANPSRCFLFCLGKRRTRSAETDAVTASIPPAMFLDLRR